jgi:hypothetical protein
MNAPHAPAPVATVEDLVNMLVHQYRDAITPVLHHQLAAMTNSPNQPIELQDISESVYLLTGRPIRDPNCYYLTYERKGVYDPGYKMPFLLRLFTNKPGLSILEQKRASLLDVFEIEIQRQLKVLLQSVIQDSSVSGLMYVTILPIDAASIQKLHEDQAKGVDHV